MEITCRVYTHPLHPPSIAVAADEKDYRFDGAPLALAKADACIAESGRNASGIAEFLKRY